MADEQHFVSVRRLSTFLSCLVVVINQSVAEHASNTTIHVTAAEKASWNSKSTFSGSYNDLTNKPSNATTSQSGFMSSTDKAKLDGIDTSTLATKTEVNAKYSKPSSGIPKTDLASAVQTSLGKADSAYQKPTNGITTSDLASSVVASLSKADKTAVVYDTVEAMISDANYLVASEKVQTLGYYSKGDAGAATYDVITSSTTPTKPYVSLGGTKYAVISNDDCINVRQAGASPDLEDNYAILSQVFANYKEISFNSSETLMITAPNDDYGLTLQEGTILHGNNATIKVNFDEDNLYSHYRLLNVMSNSIVENLNVCGERKEREAIAAPYPSGSTYEWGHGICVRGTGAATRVKNVVLQNCNVSECIGDGYSIGEVENVRVVNCSANHCRRQGISSRGAINLMIADCDFRDTLDDNTIAPGAAIDLEHESTSETDFENIIISNCKFTRCKYAVIMTSNKDTTFRVKIDSCICESNYTDYYINLIQDPNDSTGTIHPNGCIDILNSMSYGFNTGNARNQFFGVPDVTLNVANMTIRDCKALPFHIKNGINVHADNIKLLNQRSTCTCFAYVQGNSSLWLDNFYSDKTLEGLIYTGTSYGGFAAKELKIGKFEFAFVEKSTRTLDTDYAWRRITFTSDHASTLTIPAFLNGSTIEFKGVAGYDDLVILPRSRYGSAFRLTNNKKAYDLTIVGKDGVTYDCDIQDVTGTWFGNGNNGPCGLSEGNILAFWPTSDVTAPLDSIGFNGMLARNFLASSGATTNLVWIKANGAWHLLV